MIGTREVCSLGASVHSLSPTLLLHHPIKTLSTLQPTESLTSSPFNITEQTHIFLHRTLERLKLELRLSAPPPSARDPTKKPRGSKSGSDGLSFTLGELYASGSAPAPAPVGFLFGRSLGAADEKALAVGFFQEVPLASQIADVEHCLKVRLSDAQILHYTYAYDMRHP